MNANWLSLIGGVVAVASVAAAWWLHRQRVARLQHRLDVAEDSRLELAEEATVLRQRLRALGPPVLPLSDALERRAVLERVLDHAPAAAPSTWPDTEPMSVPPDSHEFAPTQPATITGVR